MSRKSKTKRPRKGKSPSKRKRQKKVRAPYKSPRKQHKVTRRVSRPRKVAPKRQKSQRKKQRSKSDQWLETAIREMNRGRSLSAAARALSLSAKDLQQQLKRKRLIKRKGHRWVIKDDRLRRIPVMSRGRFRTLTVRGFGAAHLVATHHRAVGEFVRTNDIKLLKPFNGQAVLAANGRRYVLETDPNVLHRIAAIDSPPFHEIYEIVAPT